MVPLHPGMLAAFTHAFTDLYWTQPGHPSQMLAANSISKIIQEATRRFLDEAPQVPACVIHAEYSTAKSIFQYE